MFLYYVRRLNSTRLFRRRPRLTCRNFCCCILFLFLLSLIAGLALLLLVILPTQRLREIEERYFSELERLDERESLYKWVYEKMDLRSKNESDEGIDALAGEKPKPWNERLMPLIHDVTQLSSWGYQEQMHLHEDGTAEYPMQEFWIYFAGTPSTRTNSFTNVSGSCQDPPYICEGYNAAFNRLLEYFHTHRVNTTSNAGLAFVDCDVSPLLCNASPFVGLGVDPVMLVNVRTSLPCRTQFQPTFGWSCTVTWRYISLPLQKMPWSPTVRFAQPGGKVSAHLPVFPSQFEQLKALVGYQGAEEAFELEEWELVVFSPDLDDKVGGETEDGKKLVSEKKSEFGRKGVWDADMGPVGTVFCKVSCYSALGWRKSMNWWNGVDEELEFDCCKGACDVEDDGLS